MKLHFTAGEPSGDAFGAEVISRIQAHTSAVAISSVGGAAMAKLSDHVGDIDVSPISVLGFVEGIKAYREVIRLADETAAHILGTRPDAAVLIDSWGFTLRVAQRVRKANPNIRLIKLIGPQIWATRPGRARVLAASVDHLICIHEMEVPFYAPYDLKVTVMGYPALAHSHKGSGARFRDAYNIAPNQPLLLVAPGSRASEIERVAPVLIGAARHLKASVEELSVAVIPAPNMRERLLLQCPDLAEWACLAAPDEKYDAMAASDLALACSGTVTSELAMQGTPFITGYKVSSISWFLAKWMGVLRTPYITLINAVAGRAVVPELLQSELSVENVVGVSRQLLEQSDLYRSQIEGQQEALKVMGSGGPPASEVAAEAILADLGWDA